MLKGLRSIIEYLQYKNIIDIHNFRSKYLDEANGM